MKAVIPAEKRVQPGFENVSVAVAPRRQLAAQNVALFEQRGAPAGVGEILRCGKPGRSTADDERIVPGARTGRRVEAAAWGIGRNEQN
jgi:hypothetical protein